MPLTRSGRSDRERRLMAGPTVGSACSGIGCIDLGLERAGFEPAWQIEIDPTCRDVLARHWPSVDRLEDLKDAARSTLPRVDLIAGGTPCQDLSVAGKGAGLDGERSSLFYDFVRLADSQPWAFVLWENVAGALSSNEGHDFAVCLEGFTGVRLEVPPDGWRGAGVAFGPLRWCVWWLADAQFFGVAQRRRRVYVVAGPRGRCGPEILLEREGVRRDLAPGREAGSRAAALSAGRPGSGRRQVASGQIVGSLQTHAANRCGADGAAAGHIVSALTASEGGADENDCQAGRIVDSPLSTRGYGYDQLGAESQIVVTGPLCRDGGGTKHPCAGSANDLSMLVVDEVQITHPENRSNPKPGDPAPALAGTGRPMVYQCHGSNVGPMGTLRAGNGNQGGGVPFLAAPLTASIGKTVNTAGSGGSGPKNLVMETRPRRLVPIETERLQGLPDHWTKYRADGSEIADGPRYRMIGNGAAVPHVLWIGKRIMKALRQTDDRSGTATPRETPSRAPVGPPETRKSPRLP